MTSVSVTRDTLGRNAVYFIVDVLRKNLTDTQTPARPGAEWILKSQTFGPIDKSDLPRIVLDIEDLSYKSIDIAGTLHKPNPIMVECNVYAGGVANALANRDQFADSIRTTLFNPDSADTDGKTLKQSYLILRSFRESVRDFHSADHPMLIRCKRITMDFRYYGG